jgi:hypothetical protein
LVTTAELALSLPQLHGTQPGRGSVVATYGIGDSIVRKVAGVAISAHQEDEKEEEEVEILWHSEEN